MKIDSIRPQSSFLSAEKDLDIIIDKMLKNKRLTRLLYHTTPDALTMRDLTDDEIVELIGKNIKNVPKLTVDGDVLNYIIINFDNFTPNGNNPQFRDNIVEFDIICHFDQWQLKDLGLRPYKIAAEIDSMFNNKKLTGIGELQFLGGNQIVLNSEFAGFCLMYEAIHGGEDKAPMTGNEDVERYFSDFHDIYKQ